MTPERKATPEQPTSERAARLLEHMKQQAEARAKARKDLEWWELLGKKIGAIGCGLLVVMLAGGLLGFAWVVVHFIQKAW